jgi:hypothetical protein
MTQAPPVPNATATGDLPVNMASFRWHLRAENASPNTVLAYVGAVEQLGDYLRANGMPTDVAKIRREHVEASITHIVEATKPDGTRKWKPATANDRFRGCQRFFNWLVDEGEMLLEDESGSATARDLPGLTGLGDESEVTAGSDEPSDRFAGQVHVQRPDGDAWLLVDLERHVKQEAAEAAFEKARQQLETGSMQDLEIRECPAVAPGAYAYTAAGDASGLRYAVVRLRVGTTLAAVQFLTPSVVDALDGVLALAEAQALCLVEGCAEPVGVPEELTR